jgi:hypothetical protein
MQNITLYGQNRYVPDDGHVWPKHAIKTLYEIFLGVKDSQHVILTADCLESVGALTYLNPMGL